MTQLAISFSSAKKYIRPLLLMLFFVFVFSVLFYQAWNLQIRQHADYQKKAADLYKSYREERLYAPRGVIYARSGFSETSQPVRLADSETLYTLYLYPPAIRKPKSPFTNEAISELASLLQIDEDKIREAISLPKSSYALVRGLTENQKDDISNRDRLKKSMIYGCMKLIPTPKRRYIREKLAKSIIGTVNPDQKALSGIELKFDSYLSGKPETLPELRLPRGAQDKVAVALPESHFSLPQPGNDVYLTIHERMQEELEQILENGIETLKEEIGLKKGIEGSAVAMDPKTGAILALTSQGQSALDPLEPGSSQKPFSFTAALEQGLVNPNEEWDCENGRWHIPGTPASESDIRDSEPHSVLTTTQCFARSSNICAAKIARRLGKDKLFDFYKKIGFGSPVSSDLSGEQGGDIPPLSKWDDKTFATISFGQGMTATPLQIVAGIAAFANGGIYNQPYVVEKIASPAGQLVYEAAPKRQRIVSEATAAIISKMMRAVMGKKGTAQGKDLPEYPLACKTGTAQKVNPKVKKKGYDRNLWTASLVCFGPYAPNSKLVEPRLALGVFISLDFSSLDLKGVDGEEKLPKHTGAETAGPITVKAMKNLLTIMRVPTITNTSVNNRRSE